MVTLVSNSLLGEELLSAQSPPPCTGLPMWAAETPGSVAKEGSPPPPRGRLGPRVRPGDFSVYFLALQRVAHCPAPRMALALALT